MGKLEQDSKKRLRKTRTQEAILQVIFSGGRIGGDLLVKQIVDHLLDTDFSITRPRRKEIVKSAASRLTKKGLISYLNGHYRITKEGDKILDHWRMARYTIKRPKKWDKRWRVIIFDIPESKRKMRDRAREILLASGFRKLQNSVWVYPYDCEDIIGLMKMDLGIGTHLLYMIVDQIENDRYLRMDFDLL